MRRVTKLECFQAYFGETVHVCNTFRTWMESREVDCAAQVVWEDDIFWFLVLSSANPLQLEYCTSWFKWVQAECSCCTLLSGHFLHEPLLETHILLFPLGKIHKALVALDLPITELMLLGGTAVIFRSDFAPEKGSVVLRATSTTGSFTILTTHRALCANRV